MTEIKEIKEAYIETCEEEVIKIDITKYPNTMFETTYQFKKRIKPMETNIIIKTKYSKEYMEIILGILDGEININRYNKEEAEWIQAVKEFYPNYEPHEENEDMDEENIDNNDEEYDDEYWEYEENNMKEQIDREPYAYREIKKYMDEFDI
jgi:hypothetical protein